MIVLILEELFRSTKSKHSRRTEMEIRGSGRNTITSMVWVGSNSGLCGKGVMFRDIGAFDSVEDRCYCSH